MPITKRTSRNQVTIPKEIAGKFPGIEYFEVSARDKEIVLRPISLPEDDTLSRVRDRMVELGLTEKDVDEAIEWARRKS